MNSLDIWMLAVALAMDCFTVSIVSGVIVRRWLWGMIIRMAFLFGLFQAVMPLMGWLATNHFSEQLEAVDHWIAFGLLAFIGGKMMWESEHETRETTIGWQLSRLLILAVATSIDALATGVIFIPVPEMLWTGIGLIGLVSFCFSLAGYHVGKEMGRRIRMNLELIGGIVLIGIGLKIWIEGVCL